MRVIDLIERKKRGGKLSAKELREFVLGYVRGDIPDYQVSALLMAIWFSGMNPEETYELTVAMAESGDQIDLSAIPGTKVDKHSTGGVADTTTLIVAPLVAACGGIVAKMSGRGLGHTGGTLDKLESIPGYSVDLGMDEFVRIVNRCGVSVIGQTGSLVPADKKLYALRDVTGTIDNLSLIASSIMSKKIAAGADAVVLDVKTGSGAFMQNADAAVELAATMVDIGKRSGRRTVALVTDMNQPLGKAVGNASEVREAIEILRGERIGDLMDVSVELAAQMLALVASDIEHEEAGRKIREAIGSGAGLARLACMIEAHGGDPRVVENTGLLPAARDTVAVRSTRRGYLGRIDTAEIGVSALLLGAGRTRKTDAIDPAVGIWMKKRLGDAVEVGEPIALFQVNDRSGLDEAVARFEAACHIVEEQPASLDLIYERIT
jgi:pyrimidine-nucleoside phosphorylase